MPEKIYDGNSAVNLKTTLNKSRKYDSSFAVKKILSPAFTGICFGGANLCNTVLAGRMKSAVFFPLQNVSAILLTTLLSVVIFKEKLTWKTTLILVLGIFVIMLFSV